jgi:CHAT domain-containing protein/Flp pilus assembly protein TadD
MTTLSKSFISRSLLIVTLLLGLVQGRFGQSAAPEVRQLTTTPARYKIGGDDRHSYVIQLRQNDFLQVHADQKHADVLLRLLGQDDQELARMNFLNRDDVVETLSFVAPRTENYKLEVTMFDPKAPRDQEAHYLISREELRRATPRDRRRVEVEALFVAAMAEREQRHMAQAIDKFNHALAGWQELSDSYMADLTAWKIKQSKAVDVYLKALAIWTEQKVQELQTARAQFETAARLFHEIRDPYHEYTSIMGAAAISQGLGEYQKAIDLTEQALPFFRTLPDLPDEKAVLGNLAEMHVNVARNDDQAGNSYAAIGHHLSALSIFKQLKDKQDDEATTESNLGALYSKVGQNDDALKYLEQALQYRENRPDQCPLRGTLINIGVVFDAKGDKTNALTFLNRALGKGKDDNTCPKERASALTDIGKFYNDIGANELALTYLCPSAKLPENISDKSLAAATHNNLGNSYYGLALNDKAPNDKVLYAKALESYDIAQRLFQQSKDQKSLATVLSNIGVVYSVQGRNDEALKQFTQALELRQYLGDGQGEAIALNNIGEVRAAKGETVAARANFDQALPLFRAAGDRNGEAVTLGNEMVVWNSIGNRPMAIFYGKQAVNLFQELRGAVRGLDNGIQRDYLRTVRRSYELLAELLIAEGRYEQAVQVLNLYQDETFFDFDVEPNSSVPVTNFTSRERVFAAHYQVVSLGLEQLGARIRDLIRQLRFRPPKEGELDELQNLKNQFKAATEMFSAVLKEGENELARPAGNDDPSQAVKDIGDFRQILATIAERKQKSVALYTLSGKDKLHILLVKPDGVEAYSHAVSSDDLAKKVDSLLAVLKNRRINGSTLINPSAELYDLIFKSTLNRDQTRTLGADLASYQPDVLLWSLAGSLRRVPMAALYDRTASQYLVEKYQSVVFTRSKKDRFLRESVSWLGGIAFGKSNEPKTSCGPATPLPRTDDSCELLPTPENAKDGVLIALQSVEEDLREIARILGGRGLLNDQFTLESFEQNVRNHPLVHISSHFCLQAGDADSFLLLGNDDKLSLAALKTQRNLFDGVDLLVLSACDTALQGNQKSHREIDSMAELSQRLRASSVIATLWNADATGAGKLMIEVYKLHQLKPSLSKAELLRQAQLSFLHNKVRAAQNINHPSFWAPFVLYGNFL